MPDLAESAPPNHHASHPGFAGVRGLVAALTFTVGRGGDADLAVDLTATGAGDRVVDIGCGPGVAARRAVARGASSAVGVDPATVMLRVARVLTRTRVRYLAGAAEALPLPDGCATAVWSLATVHHWKDLDAGLAEVRRVLRPGGRFLAVERRITDPGARGHASHGWTDAQARRFADRCHILGFRDVDVADHEPRRGRRVLSVLART